MKHEITNWHEQRTVRFDITDAEPRKVPYTSVQGRVYRPESARVEWRRGGDDPSWAVTRVEIQGPHLKKDGSDSANHANQAFNWAFGRIPENQPEWLADVIEASSPTAGGPPYMIEGCEHCAGCGEGAENCVCDNTEEEDDGS